MAIRLFVGNLPNNVTETQLREHFSKVGPLSYISVPTDRETGRQRGFAFLEFQDRAQADEAIRSFNNAPFNGNSLSVKEARPRDDSRGPSRPAFSRPGSATESAAANSPAHKPGPNFGPDASPQRSHTKAKGKPNSERGPKGPMREVVRGQFFGEDDDDDYDDTDDNYDADFDDAETSEENVAHRESDVDELDEDKSETQFSGLGLR